MRAGQRRTQAHGLLRSSAGSTHCVMERSARRETRSTVKRRTQASAALAAGALLVALSGPAAAQTQAPVAPAAQPAVQAPRPATSAPAVQAPAAPAAQPAVQAPRPATTTAPAVQAPRPATTTAPAVQAPAAAPARAGGIAGVVVAGAMSLVGAASIGSGLLLRRRRA